MEEEARCLSHWLLFQMLPLNFHYQLQKKYRLKSSIIIGDLSVFLCNSNIFTYINFNTLLLRVYKFKFVLFFMVSCLLSGCVMALFISNNVFDLLYLFDSFIFRLSMSFLEYSNSWLKFFKYEKLFFWADISCLFTVIRIIYV